MPSVTCLKLFFFLGLNWPKRSKYTTPHKNQKTKADIWNRTQHSHKISFSEWLRLKRSDSSQSIQPYQPAKFWGKHIYSGISTAEVTDLQILHLFFREEKNIFVYIPLNTVLCIRQDVFMSLTQTPSFNFKMQNSFYYRYPKLFQLNLDFIHVAAFFRVAQLC